LFIGESKRYVKKKGSGNGQLSVGAPLRRLEEGCLPGTLQDSKRVLDKWSVSLWELCEGNLEGWFLY